MDTNLWKGQVCFNCLTRLILCAVYYIYDLHQTLTVDIFVAIAFCVASS